MNDKQKTRPGIAQEAFREIEKQGVDVSDEPTFLGALVKAREIISSRASSARRTVKRLEELAADWQTLGDAPAANDDVWQQTEHANGRA